jgi:ADP-ribosylglycohydrolase
VSPDQPHQGATDAATDPVTDRATASLFGLAIGDALGMPTQGLPPARAAAVLTEDDFVPAPADQPLSPGLAAGTVTDDTEQALVLAELLVEGGGHVDPLRFAAQLLAWERHVAARGSLDLLGPSTRRALHAIAEGQDPTTTGATGSTNGAAMRVAPVGIATPDDSVERLVRQVVLVDRPTHDTTVAHAGAAAVAALISAAVSGAAFTDALPFALDCARCAALEGHWIAGADVAERIQWAVLLAQDTWHARGPQATVDVIGGLVGTSLATQESVPAAFAIAATYADQPWQAALAAARLGGDSDTIAAMVGAMLGACHGLAGWPDRAMTTVTEVNGLELAGLAESLVGLRRLPTWSSVREPQP